ncbi:hypothetical protein SKUN_00689 [Spiroplasma kunkelii CR2-3x]|uniref:Uncharacterized protein n=1 Tax=Spiroplasma kunkelii CR2-3x TaxID=273035 RepID=A0A0K2JGM9_SPIKU|nr:hypothetical protein [Spiroplasma kunkelii]ALA97582.1 hypothetical protein SKUN_00689 [Spiroplasma kunkelii CR2-3x]
MLRFQFIAIYLGVLTGGLGDAVVQGLNATQLTISTTRIAIFLLSNFLVMEFNDILNKNVNLKNTLLNLFFYVNEFGKLGTGMRQQKLLNFANQEKIFQKMGLNFEIKNFWQAQQN